MRKVDWIDTLFHVMNDVTMTFTKTTLDGDSVDNKSKQRDGWTESWQTFLSSVDLIGGESLRLRLLVRWIQRAKIVGSTQAKRTNAEYRGTENKFPSTE